MLFMYCIIVKNKLRMSSNHSFLQDWNFPFSEGTPFFLKQIQKATLLFLGAIQIAACSIVKNTLKWRCYISYYTKSIEYIINITLVTFRLNSTFLIIGLLNLMCIKLKYIRVFLDIYQYILCAESNKRKKITYQLWKHTKCLISGSI